MTPLLFIVAAGAGAVVRHAVGQFACSWVALLWVNAAGTALLGFGVAAGWPPATLTVVGVGFCGALTTFSSVSLETWTLARTVGALRAVGYAALMVAVCVGAVSVGTTLAR